MDEKLSSLIMIPEINVADEETVATSARFPFLSSEPNTQDEHKDSLKVQFN